MTNNFSNLRFFTFRPDRAWSLDKEHILFLVTCRSSKERRERMQLVEEIYSQELNYSARFKIDDCDCNKGLSRGKCYRGFLFADSSAGIVGGCMFQWRTWGGIVNHFFGQIPDAAFTQWWQDRHPHPCWSLQWVWIAPDYRRKGFLRDSWPLFRHIFGIRPSLDFFMEGPYSDEFESFLRSMGYEVTEDDQQNLTWRPPPE